MCLALPSTGKKKDISVRTKLIAMKIGSIVMLTSRTIRSELCILSHNGRGSSLNSDTISCNNTVALGAAVTEASGIRVRSSS